MSLNDDLKGSMRMKKAKKHAKALAQMAAKNDAARSTALIAIAQNAAAAEESLKKKKKPK